MKIERVKYFAVLSMFALLVACAPMSSFTSIHDVETRNATQNNRSDLDHIALAKQYENLAREMQAKVKEQEEVLEHKSRSSLFGKNGRNIKSHVAFKIREYKQVAQENLEKATFHREIAAEQVDQKSAAKVNQTNELINKAKKKLNSKNSL